jgi:hypothetical protein
MQPLRPDLDTGSIEYSGGIRTVYDRALRALTGLSTPFPGPNSTVVTVLSLLIRNEVGQRAYDSRTSGCLTGGAHVFIRTPWHKTCVVTQRMDASNRLAAARMTTQRILNRHTRATEDDDRSPFPSLESAQEYIALLGSAIADAQSDIHQDLEAAGNDHAARRQEALRLVDYKLGQLRNHMNASGRLLNDLRTLRRLLLSERRLNGDTANVESHRN